MDDEPSATDWSAAPAELVPAFVLGLNWSEGQSPVIDALGTLRGDEFVATYKFKWNATSWPGVVVRWLSPREFLTVWLSPDDGKAYLYRQTADRAEEEFVAASSSGVTLTTGQWYDAKVVVHDDAGNQVLDFYVDANQDSDFLDAGEQLFDDEGAIDDNWSAGYVGLANWLETAQEFDDLRVGIDNNSDGDIADAGDDVEIDDDFSSTTMSLTYDDNGNLTDDGLFKYVYDAWNRLVEVTRRVDDETTVAEYEYDGDDRRVEKVVTNCGVEDTPNDGGNTTLHFYYSNRWQILETRGGSNQTLAQYIWGMRYVDELVMIEVNENPGTNNTANKDDDGSDSRYFVHQDRNWNVVALSEYDTSGTNNGRIVERYAYSPYGEFVVLAGDSGSGETGYTRPTSTVGNISAHQGLSFDQDKLSYQNRRREYTAAMQRFGQRDPIAYYDSVNSYQFANATPIDRLDPTGLSVRVHEPTIDQDVNAVEFCSSLLGDDPPWSGAAFGHTTRTGEFVCTDPVVIATVSKNIPGCPCDQGYQCVTRINCEPDFDIYVHVNWLTATPEQLAEYPQLQSAIDHINERVLAHEMEHARRHTAMLVPYTEVGKGEACTEIAACANAATNAISNARQTGADNVALDDFYRDHWDDTDYPNIGEFVYEECQWALGHGEY